ncbi:MAG: hypothetical protein R2792_04650 [Saprospiraceae bacterium]
MAASGYVQANPEKTIHRPDPWHQSNTLPCPVFHSKRTNAASMEIVQQIYHGIRIIFLQDDKAFCPFAEKSNVLGFRSWATVAPGPNKRTPAARKLAACPLNAEKPTVSTLA